VTLNASFRSFLLPQWNGGEMHIWEQVGAASTLENRGAVWEEPHRVDKREEIKVLHNLSDSRLRWYIKDEGKGKFS
jgi:hypothetical protein